MAITTASRGSGHESIGFGFVLVFQVRNGAAVWVNFELVWRF
jgi:hypothetical protein